ncbi:hypothetical protein [Sinosporangium siamense]|uniref:hypothetical protein n=1 Tax=Sinosporangium siamense TaxID=1367973 RepID=UPI00194FF1FF|nr:hypothetical protein [Sinosporangium siamense]
MNDEVIDQIVFSWSEYGPYGRGLGAQATSLAKSDLDYWNEHLRGFAGMVNAGFVTRPAHSLCYVVIGTEAALLHRTRGADPLSRSEVAHALVGPVAELTARLSLGLSRWPWVMTADLAEGVPLSMPPVGLADLADACDRAIDRVETRARRAGDQLRPMLAAALAQPGEPLSVITQGDDPEPLTWGMIEILDPLYSGSDLDTTWRWTFSTYETRHDPGRLWMPNLLFMPVRPGGGVRRRIVDLADGVVPGDPLLNAVDSLLDAYGQGGGRRVRELLDECGARTPHSVRDRVAALAAGTIPRASRPPQAELAEWPAAAVSGDLLAPEGIAAYRWPVWPEVPPYAPPVQPEPVRFEDAPEDEGHEHSEVTEAPGPLEPEPGGESQEPAETEPTATEPLETQPAEKAAPPGGEVLKPHLTPPPGPRLQGRPRRKEGSRRTHDREDDLQRIADKRTPEEETYELARRLAGDGWNAEVYAALGKRWWDEHEQDTLVRDRLPLGLSQGHYVILLVVGSVVLVAFALLGGQVR